MIKQKPVFMKVKGGGWPYAYIWAQEIKTKSIQAKRKFCYVCSDESFARFPDHFYQKICEQQIVLTQPAFTCSKLIVETLEQGVKYVSS